MPCQRSSSFSAQLFTDFTCSCRAYARPNSPARRLARDDLNEAVLRRFASCAGRVQTRDEVSGVQVRLVTRCIWRKRSDRRPDTHRPSTSTVGVYGQFFFILRTMLVCGSGPSRRSSGKRTVTFLVSFPILWYRTKPDQLTGAFTTWWFFCGRVCESTMLPKCIKKAHDWGSETTRAHISGDTDR